MKKKSIDHGFRNKLLFNKDIKIKDKNIDMIYFFLMIAYVTKPTKN